MEEYKELSELLESDSGAMAFYNSLTTPLRMQLHRGGVRNFKALYDSVSHSGTALSAAEIPSASAHEATGSIPAGGDRTLSEWEDSRRLSH